MSQVYLIAPWLIASAAVASASCGGLGDVCSATASDFAGTYTVLVDDARRCYCSDMVDMAGDCSARCAMPIANGAVCNAEQTYCEYYQREAQSAMFTIGSDGSVTIVAMQGGAADQTSADCDVNITNFCDLSFSCQTLGSGMITATWKKVK